MKRATARLVADFGDDLVRYRVNCPVCGCENYYDDFIGNRRTVLDCLECEEIIGIKYDEDRN